MSPPSIARIVIGLALDRPFDYLIPPALMGQVRVGSQVRVPFRHSQQVGIVVSLAATSAFTELKAITAVVGKRERLSPALIALGEWMADYYCCARESAIGALLPGVVRKADKGAKLQATVQLAPGVEVAAAASALEAHKPSRRRQAEVLRLLADGKVHTVADFQRTSGCTAAVIAALHQAALVVVQDEAQARDPFAGLEILPSGPLALTEQQRAAYEAIVASFSLPQPEVLLLLGVTGSGKTEVYLQAIAECLQRERQAIVLVPEISLTPQTMERFRSRFDTRVSVLHSHLSDGERFDEWSRISEGAVDIVVGARSAVFAPFRRLGLIVVDEEHETSYKQGDLAPRYHARDVAVMRGRLEQATVVLGSATPALESYYNASVGKYRTLMLTQRIDDQVMPAMEIVDMGAEAMATGKPQILSRRLMDLMRGTLERSEQIILFLNRRGYATHLQCLKCGYSAQCDDCSVNFTFHKSQATLLCHLCGAQRAAPTSCPQCGDPAIRYGGLGTERVETYVRACFPKRKVLRMDSDTMTRKDSYREALSDFRAGAVDILIGTQMIAKGLHFPNVTLVGIINADLGLNMPDFRADERTFQLLVQVAGRAGRGDTAGRVVVQAYSPHHESIRAACAHDLESFYEWEIGNRKEADFPPVTHLVAIQFRGPTEATVAATAQTFVDELRPLLPPAARLIPALPCATVKKRGLYHYQVLCYTQKVVTVSRGLKKVLAAFKAPADVKLSVDVDPQMVG